MNLTKADFLALWKGRPKVEPCRSIRRYILNRSTYKCVELY